MIPHDPHAMNKDAGTDLHVRVKDASSDPCVIVQDASNDPSSDPCHPLIQGSEQQIQR